jgi:hypothetical protein
MPQFSLNLSDELNDIIQKCCKVSGRSRNSACVQWILEGALRELKMYEEAKILTGQHHSTPLLLPEDEPEE